MPLCEYVIQTLRYNGRDRRRHREVRDIGTVMSTPVESDKRELVCIMSPPAWRWHVGGMERKREGGID